LVECGNGMAENSPGGESLTPTPNQLWNLSGTLFELLELREESSAIVRSLEAQPDSREDDLTVANTELATTESSIQNFVAQQLRDVDGLRAPLKALEQGVALNKADAAAATNRAMVLQNRYDRLKDLIRECMIALDQAGEWKPKESRKFESARGSLSLRGNGGAQPVEITDEALVPDEYCRVSVTMTALQWAEIVDYIPPVAMPHDPPLKVGPREVSKSAIAEALAKKCEHCDGNGVVEAWGELDEDAEYRPAENPCSACGGSGTQGVPGARLLPRGQSLQIK